MKFAHRIIAFFLLALFLLTSVEARFKSYYRRRLQEAKNNAAKEGEYIVIETTSAKDKSFAELAKNIFGAEIKFDLKDTKAKSK